MRVLIAARLSVAGDREEASRIERDEADARTWAEREGAEVIEVTRDRGVSGGVSPFKRPQLGPWLTDPTLMRRYDAIVASSVDRLGRSARDLDELKNWSTDNGKRLVVLKPDLVWPVASGTAGAAHRIMWSLLGDLAEIEREVITERIAGGVGQARANGAFVGKPMRPWFTVTGPKYERTPVLVESLRPTLRELIDRAMSGASFVELARWLDTTGVKPPAAGRSVKGKSGTTIASDLWSPVSVAHTLRSEDLKGRRTEAGHTHRFESIMTVAEWNQLQSRLPRGSRGSASRDYLLTGIIRCGKCGGPMYAMRDNSKSRTGLFNYRCKGTDQIPSTCRNTVRLEDIEAWTDAHFAAPSDNHTGGPFGSVELIETVVIPGEGHQAEVDEIDAEVRELDPNAIDWLERVTALRARRAELMAMPGEADRIEHRPTGRTVGDVWASFDQAQRRAYLVAAGIEVVVVSNAELRAKGLDQRFMTGGDPRMVAGTLSAIAG
jgi:site-specific DNA recombinase